MQHLRSAALILAMAGIGLLAAPALGQSKPAELAHEYLVRGSAALEMARTDRDLEAAEKEFRTATEIDPTLAGAWMNLGGVQAKLKKFAAAKASFQKYLELKPGAEDAQKVRDEIIKLQYRMERMEDEFKPGWTQLARHGDGSTIHIDKSTLKKDGGSATVLFLWDLAGPAQGGWGYQSMKGQIRIDCRGNQWTLDRFESFAEHMGKGEIKQSSQAMNWEPAKMWKPMQSTHWAGVVGKAVCE